MTGKTYGTIMIGIDKTKTLRDVKLQIIKYIKNTSCESISENNFELYRINERPINPGLFSIIFHMDYIIWYESYRMIYLVGLSNTSTYDNKLKTKKQNR